MCPDPAHVPKKMHRSSVIFSREITRFSYSQFTIPNLLTNLHTYCNITYNIPCTPRHLIIPHQTPLPQASPSPPVLPRAAPPTPSPHTTGLHHGLAPGRTRLPPRPPVASHSRAVQPAPPSPAAAARLLPRRDARHRRRLFWLVLRFVSVCLEG